MKQTIKWLGGHFSMISEKERGLQDTGTTQPQRC